MSEQKNQRNNQSIRQRPVRELQDGLSHDMDARNDFLNASNSSSDDSESDVSQACRIVVPKHRRKRDPNTMLMEQLVAQQKAFLKSQRKVYKLKAEIDTTEVRERYLKLDLNNAQVAVEELKEKAKERDEILFYARAENWGMRMVVLLYILLNIYTLLMGA
jgi:hypothetical protein